MRILFTSFPATGHLLPMVPLADAVHDAGDQVLISAHADQAPLVGQLPFRATGPSLPELLAESERRTNVSLRDNDVVTSQKAGVAMFTALRAELSLGGCLEVARDFAPDLIVAEMWDYTAPLVSSQLGIPYVTFSHSPDTLIDEPLALGLQDSFAEFNIQPARPLALIQLWPDWLQLEGHAAAPNEVPTGFTPLPAANPRRGSGQPTVLVSFGTAVADRGLLERTVASALQTGARLVVTTLSGIPADTFSFERDRVSVVEFTPIDDLLTGADAVITAGGSGTTLAALRRGLPIVFVPQIANQPVIADAVASYGAGVVCGDAGEVAEGLSTVLRLPAYAARAQHAAETLAARPTPATTWSALRPRIRPHA